MKLIKQNKFQKSKNKIIKNCINKIIIKNKKLVNFKKK